MSALSELEENMGRYYDGAPFDAEVRPGFFLSGFLSAITSPY
jgi:hypothetical protein